MCLGSTPKMPAPVPPPPRVPPPSPTADTVAQPGDAMATREGKKARKRRQGSKGMRTAGLQINT